MKLFKTILFIVFILSIMNSNLNAQKITIIHAGKLLAVPGEGVTTEKTLIVENSLISSIKDGFISPTDLGFTNDSVKLVDLAKSL